MKIMISNEILLAYTQCKLKAYLLLFFKFLLSEEKDVDLFKTPEIVKHTKSFKTDTANKSD